MKYCADTWFILEAFSKNPQAVALIQETRAGKTRIVISIMVYAEASKKLMQRGISQDVIEQFFDGVEASEHVELILVDKAIAREAARLSLSFHVPLIDSVVAATCTLTGCDLLLSGDGDYEPLTKRRYLKLRSW